jgi:UrcA family protein
MLIRIVSVLGAMAATAATLAFATPAAAQTEDRSVFVSIADLDPSNPADAVRLDRRLQAAARSVCGPDEGANIKARQQMSDCQTIALRRANAQVEVALRGGGSKTIALSTN